MFRRLFYSAILMLAVGMSGVAHATNEAQQWGIKNGANWTQNDNVQVRYFFTENGVMVGTAQLFIGPLLPTDPGRPVVTSQFIGSGRTICLGAEAFRSVVPDTTVAAVVAPGVLPCHTFPFGPLDAPIITDTP